MQELETLIELIKKGPLAIPIGHRRGPDFAEGKRPGDCRRRGFLSSPASKKCS